MGSPWRSTQSKPLERGRANFAPGRESTQHCACRKPMIHVEAIWLSSDDRAGRSFASILKTDDQLFEIHEAHGMVADSTRIVPVDIMANDERESLRV